MLYYRLDAMFREASVDEGIDVAMFLLVLVAADTVTTEDSLVQQVSVSRQH